MPKPTSRRPLLAAITALAVTSCSGKEVALTKDTPRIEVTSSAFTTGGEIPTRHACKGQGGEDRSPELSWSGVPAAAKSLAIVADDPDAPMGTWVHWVAYGIPTTVTEVPEGLDASAELSAGGKQGNNSWKKPGYGGPCPPKGTHRYFFKVYALDIEPALASGATKDDLVKAIDGHVVAAGELMGTFTRK
ncbi:MAG: YbhB/YbcL family Raf kinase inhibitor-like protein [Acidobacteriota bacterium]